VTTANIMVKQLKTTSCFEYSSNFRFLQILLQTETILTVLTFVTAVRFY